LIPRVVQREGRAVKGFRVLVGGGLGVTPERGRVLEEFVEEEKMLSVCEALVCMFDRLGDREHKRRARMKFIMRKLEMEKFREEYERELKDVCMNGGVKGVEVSLEEERGPSADRPDDHEEVADDDFDRWRKTNVFPQKQIGLVAVKVRLPRGDVTGEQFRSLAPLTSDCGRGTLRTVIDQNLLVPWIPEGNIYRAYERLAAMGLNRANGGLISDVISCPGAETCRMGVAASRDLASCLAGYLENDPDASALAEEASELRIKVSGCPNSCGQHHVGDIGLHGGVTHVKGKRVPAYHFLLGGRVDERGAFFGRDFGKIPVRRLPQATKRILELYVKERREKERASEYLQRIDEKTVRAAISDLTDIREENLKEEDFGDLG
jgi:sulfite reductase beta subunit-like hemoprotein